MRKPFIAGNWKMNNTISESLDLVRKLKTKVLDVKNVTIAVCPPFTALKSVSEILKDSNIKLGAQNMMFKENGAFTGEISPLMVKDTGCSYVILGHSERRKYFRESDSIINKKLKIALEHDILPIVCVGELLEEREKGLHFAVVKKQIKGVFEEIAKADMSKITVAYEPVWAIGTGKTATPQDADAMHSNIREVLTEMYDEEVSKNIIIQYGGSVKPDNVDGLMAMPNIDGALVGGAALDADGFARIIKFE